MNIVEQSCILILIVFTVSIVLMMKYEKKIPKRTAKVVERDIERVAVTIDSLAAYRIVSQDCHIVASIDDEIRRQQQLRLALYNEIKELHWQDTGTTTNSKVIVQEPSKFRPRLVLYPRSVS